MSKSTCVGLWLRTHYQDKIAQLAKVNAGSLCGRTAGRAILFQGCRLPVCAYHFGRITMELHAKKVPFKIDKLTA